MRNGVLDVDGYVALGVAIIKLKFNELSMGGLYLEVLVIVNNTLATISPDNCDIIIIVSMILLTLLY